MLDESLFVVYKSDMPLKLLQSVLSLFLSIGSMIDSLYSSGNWDICDFKKGYRPRTNVVKDEKGDLATDLHTIVARLRKYISQLLILLGVNEAGQTEIHTAEPLVPEPSAFGVEMTVENIKRHKSPGTDTIPA
jgi:hypothetical protein